VSRPTRSRIQEARRHSATSYGSRCTQSSLRAEAPDRRGRWQMAWARRQQKTEEAVERGGSGYQEQSENCWTKSTSREECARGVRAAGAQRIRPSARSPAPFPGRLRHLGHGAGGKHLLPLTMPCFGAFGGASKRPPLQTPALKSCPAARPWRSPPISFVVKPPSVPRWLDRSFSPSTERSTTSPSWAPLPTGSRPLS